MNIWHLTPDTPRQPNRVRPGEVVNLHSGPWPMEPGRSVWVTTRVERTDGTSQTSRAEAMWQRNEGANSYWRAEIGPFDKGERVTYSVYGRSPVGKITGPTCSFRVAPK